MNNVNETKKFTLQETFDFVCKKVIEQGKPSMKKNGLCVYKKENGMRCAAGHCIPKGKYKSGFEEEDVRGVMSKYDMTDWFGHDSNLISSLQSAHDDSSEYGSDFIGEFIRKATDIAEGYELNSKVLSDPPG